MYNQNKRIYVNYLPGFHLDEMNNLWWGNNFTEWFNVKNSKPLFEGHNQPRIPELGYLDLSLEADIILQCNLAKRYGISGFVIYNYWYSGKRLLYKPIEIIYNNKNIDIEYSICWANHDWTRSWTNRSGALDSLIKQEYNLESCWEHASYLVKFFKDTRYVKIGGRPILQVYNLSNKNEILYLLKLKEILINEFSIDLYLIQTLKSASDQVSLIVDNVIYFQPSFNLIQKNNELKYLNNIKNYFSKPLLRFFYSIYDLLPDKPIELDYDAVYESMFNEYGVNLGRILTAFVDFDNTPRYKKRARYFSNFTIIKFERYMDHFLSQKSFGNIYVINAWNEWGEGMYLEPDNEYGYRKLEILKKLIDRHNNQ